MQGDVGDPAEMRRAAKLRLLMARDEQCRRDFARFLRRVWWKPHQLRFGRHTLAICREIQQAVERYLRGESTFLWIALPFGHGKSDLVSRALPAWFLGRCYDRDPDVIMSGYGSGLVESFSADVKNIVRSEKYQRLFSRVQLAKGSDTVSRWRLEGKTGEVVAVGLGGGLTGKRGDLMVVDDYCKNRLEATSAAYRDRTWEGFRNDMMTRRKPVTICIVCATPWHVDDLGGRIRKAEKEDAEFPRFRRLHFPARNEDGSYLFPEMYADSWYREQYAVLGRQASALLDCNPTLEGGNRFRVDAIKVHDNPADFPQTRYVRAWDLASSSKQRDGDDPDWTVGALVTVTQANGVKSVWVKDVSSIRAEAPRRDELIRNTARADGPGVMQLVEAFGGYKDAHALLQQALRGISVVRPSQLPGDKSAKLSPLEPVFDAGNIHIMRGQWNAEFIRQFAEFPDGAHDDFCDPLAIAFAELTKAASGFL